MSQVSSDWVADAEIAPPLPAVRGTSLLRRSLRLWRTRIGVALVGLLVLVAIIGPYIAPYGPSTPVGVPNANPGGKAVLGTDYLGQDVLSRFLYGGRSILVMAVLATAPQGWIASTSWFSWIMVPQFAPLRSGESPRKARAAMTAME